MGRRWRFVTAKWGDLLGEIGVCVWRSFGQNQGDKDDGGLRPGRRVVYTFFFFGRERESKSSFFFYFFLFFSYFSLFFLFNFSSFNFFTPFFSHFSLYFFFLTIILSRVLSLSLFICFCNFSFQRWLGSFWHLLFFLSKISLLFILHYLEIFLFLTSYSKNIFIEFFFL